jgi:hypothetical protein
VALSSSSHADGGLLTDHLMEWSRDRPIYLITLARPSC